MGDLSRTIIAAKIDYLNDNLVRLQVSKVAGPEVY